MSQDNAGCTGAAARPLLGRGRMKQDTFAAEMAKIGAQARAIELAEVAALRRQLRIRRIRRVCLIAVGVILVGTAYIYRIEVGQQWNRVAEAAGIGAKKEPNPMAAQFGNNLKSIQATAAKRDEFLDSVGKK